MAKTTKPRLYLRLRSYVHGRFVSLWMIRQDGAAHTCLMYGEMPSVEAESIVATAKLPVEREQMPYDDAEPVLKQRVPSPEPNLFQGI